jgi:hypothetical protein
MTTITTEHGHKIEFNQEKHVYIHNDQYVVGMSTILGKLASPMLENWKISNQVNAIKQEMERQGISIDKIETIILNAKTNAKKQGDNILNIGSMVHKFCEMWLKGQKFTEPEDPVIKGCFDKFKKFWTKNKLKLVESEKILYSERGYCGTLDLVAKDSENNLWLIDIKTSKGIFINMVHQLHEYTLEEQHEILRRIMSGDVGRKKQWQWDLVNKKTLYTKKQILKFVEENEFTDINDFRDKHGGMWNYASRQNFADEISLNLRSRITWDINLATIEAKKYKTRKEFSLKCQKAYLWARRNNKLDQICKHMEPQRIVKKTIWTDDKIYDLLIKYGSTREFRKQDPKTCNTVVSRIYKCKEKLPKSYEWYLQNKKRKS